MNEMRQGCPWKISDEEVDKNRAKVALGAPQKDLLLLRQNPVFLETNYFAFVNPLCSTVAPTSEAERDSAGLLAGCGTHSHVGGSNALAPVSCPMEIVPLDVPPALPSPVQGDPGQTPQHCGGMVLQCGEKPLEGAKGSGLGPVGSGGGCGGAPFLGGNNLQISTGLREGLRLEHGSAGRPEGLRLTWPLAAAAARCPSAGRVAAPAPSTWPGSRPSHRT